MSIIDINKKELPDKFKLYQNVPQIFKEKTVIAFDLPADSEISLTLHDLFDKQLLIIADGEYNAGYHEIEWKPENLRPGVYIYRLRSEEFTETRKMYIL